MKLWLLKPVDDLHDDDPWSPWYDRCFGFIIRAGTEREAREIANQNAGEENRGEFLNEKIANTTTPWLDSKYSTCEVLTGDGEPGVILEDVRNA